MWSNKMTPKMYNPPMSGYMKSIRVMRGAHIGRVIGKEGKVFNAITENTKGVLYIWYNNDSKEIEIYGENMMGIMQATQKLEDRMKRVSNN